MDKIRLVKGGLMGEKYYNRREDNDNHRGSRIQGRRERGQKRGVEGYKY
jgi:hypothetical protein